MVNPDFISGNPMACHKENSIVVYTSILVHSCGCISYCKYTDALTLLLRLHSFAAN